MKNKLEMKIVHQSSDPNAWTVHVFEPAFPFKKKVESKMFNSREEMRKYIEKLKLETFTAQ